MSVDRPPPPERPRDPGVRRFPASTLGRPAPVLPVRGATSAAVVAFPSSASTVPGPGPASPAPVAAVPAPRHFDAAALTTCGARDLVGRRLAGWGVDPGAVDEARCVAAALVTHVQRTEHATCTDLEITDLGDRVSLAVVFERDGRHRVRGCSSDGSGTETSPETARFGLPAVEPVVERLGHDPHPGGGRVWAVLPAPRGRAVAPATAGPELLLRLSTALAATRTPGDVGRAVAGVVGPGFGALGVRVTVVERGRHHLVSLAQSWEQGEARRDEVVDALPSALVARTGRPLYLADRVAIARRAPALTADPQAVVIAALAAVPVEVDGDTVGVLTVVWDEPRDLSTDERALLEAIAAFTAAALHRATLAEEHRATADVLQATLLPQQLPVLPGVDLATVYRPLGFAPDVGGDWYDAFVLPSGNLYLVIGDVAGHGTTAARTMGKIRYSARAYAVAGAGPAEVLARTNALLRHHGHDLLASMLCVEYDPRRRTAVVADAGHMPALAVPERGAARFLDGPVGPMLGATDDVTYAATTHDLRPGETVLLYTDGLVERRDRAIDDCLDDLAAAAVEMRMFATSASRLAYGLADRRAASDVVTDDVCVLAVTHG